MLSGKISSVSTGGLGGDTGVNGDPVKSGCRG